MVYAPITPVNPYTPQPYGLASAVNWQMPTDNRWMGGAFWRSICGQSTSILEECIPNAEQNQASKAATFAQGYRGARAFTVYSELDCSPVGSWDQLQQLAAQGLVQSEAYEVERIFQTGDIPGTTVDVYPNLTLAAATESTLGFTLQPSTILVSGGFDVVEGLGRLEKAISGVPVTGSPCWPAGQAVIHIPLRLASAFAAQHLLEKDGPRLRTPAGNLVVIGSGYNEAIGPTGTATPAGYGWIFATGPIFGYRGPANPIGNMVEMFDRANNTSKVIIERTVLLGYDCCLAAALVSLGGEPAGVFNAST